MSAANRKRNKTGQKTQTWAMLPQESNHCIADLDPPLSQTDLRLMLKLFDKLKYGNKVEINLAKTAKDLKISRSSIMRSISELRSRCLVKDEERGMSGLKIMVNPFVIWKGTKQQQGFACAQWIEMRTNKAIEEQRQLGKTA